MSSKITTKKVFLEQLETNLKTKISYDELKNIIEHYNDYFEDALSFGEKEVDIIEDLGDIDTLTKNLIIELESAGIDLAKNELVIIEPVSTTTPVEKIIIKSVINNINVYFCETDEFSAVVDNDNYFVEYIQTLDNGVYTFKPKVDNVEIKNTTWSKVTKPLMSLNLKLPRKDYLNNQPLDINIENVSGDISLDGNDVKISGNVKIVNVNGKIAIKDFESGEIHTELVNGKNIINNMKVEKIVINKVNGNFEVNNIEANDLKVRSINGKVQFNQLKVERIDFDIVNGTCEGYLPYYYNQINFKIKQALFGEIYVDDQKYKRNQLSNSTTNDARCNFKLTSLNAKVKLYTLNK